MTTGGTFHTSAFIFSSVAFFFFFFLSKILFGSAGHLAMQSIFYRPEQQASLDFNIYRFNRSVEA